MRAIRTIRSASTRRVLRTITITMPREGTRAIPESSTSRNVSKALKANEYLGHDRPLVLQPTLVLVLSRAPTVLVIVIETGRDGRAIHRS